MKSFPCHLISMEGLHSAIRPGIWWWKRIVNRKYAKTLRIFRQVKNWKSPSSQSKCWIKIVNLHNSGRLVMLSQVTGCLKLSRLYLVWTLNKGLPWQRFEIYQHPLKKSRMKNNKMNNSQWSYRYSSRHLLRRFLEVRISLFERHLKTSLIFLHDYKI